MNSDCRQTISQWRFALIALLVICASCNSKPKKITAQNKPELPALQALPSQSLKGLNIQLPEIVNPSPIELEWIDVAAIEPQRIAFADSFSSLSGFVSRLSNGKYSQQGFDSQSRVFLIFASSDAVGNYSVCLREDAQSIGPDGQPGVMSLTWEEVPSQMGYCTFVYAGQINGNAFNLAPIVEAKSTGDLDGIQFRFRYKGTNNQSTDKLNFGFDFRLGFESEVYENRLDLGRILVTDQWQNHVVDFGQSQNVRNFLESVSRLSDRPLRLEIAHVGPIGSYRAGDTLLIDDVQVILPQRIVESLKSRISKTE